MSQRAEGSASDVIAGIARWCLIHDDSLIALRGLPDSVFDMVLTDPPYSSGGAFRGDRAQSTGTKYVTSGAEAPADFDGDTRDQRSYQLWTAIWCAEALRCAKKCAIGVVFTDWRQLAATADAFQIGGWVFRGIAVWDKTEASRPRSGGFRGQTEYMVWGTKGSLVPRDIYLDGCFRFATGRNKLHQAVKPDGLMMELLRLCPEDGTVLDPFNGAGSTGLAAIRSGLRYVGIEISAEWADLSRERLRAEVDGSTLIERKRGQTPLFGGTSNGDKSDA